jgi:hypothetical protein
LLSSSVCSSRKYCLYLEMTKLNSKKMEKNLRFIRKKIW